VKLDELAAAVGDCLSRGKIGTPVSLRMHLQLADSAVKSDAMLAPLMEIAKRVFQSPPKQLMARKTDSADQLSVLFEYTGGQTCLVTCGSGCATQASLSLLLFGTRGMARLEGGELFESRGFQADSGKDSWQNCVELSVASEKPVAIP